MKIQALTNRMHELSQDIKKLFSRIEDLQSHLDNGWRHDFINMLKRDYKQMVDETLKQALEMNKKQVE
jgi:cell division protein FtsB